VSGNTAGLGGRPRRKPLLDTLLAKLDLDEASALWAEKIRAGDWDALKFFAAQVDGLPKAETDSNSTITIRVRDESPDA
jgi:hypothetical protein